MIGYPYDWHGFETIFSEKQVTGAKELEKWTELAFSTGSPSERLLATHMLEVVSAMHQAGDWLRHERDRSQAFREAAIAKNNVMLELNDRQLKSWVPRPGVGAWYYDPERNQYIDNRTGLKYETREKLNASMEPP